MHPFLIVQRAALQRAINRARECRADGDAEILQGIIVLLDELYELTEQLTDKINRERKQ